MNSQSMDKSMGDSFVPWHWWYTQIYSK